MEYKVYRSLTPDHNNQVNIRFAFTGTVNDIARAIQIATESPEMKDWLKTSTLGLEYIITEFNHGSDIIVRVYKHA